MNSPRFTTRLDNGYPRGLLLNQGEPDVGDSSDDPTTGGGDGPRLRLLHFSTEIIEPTTTRPLMEIAWAGPTVTRHQNVTKDSLPPVSLCPSPVSPPPSPSKDFASSDSPSPSSSFSASFLLLFPSPLPIAAAVPIAAAALPLPPRWLIPLSLGYGPGVMDLVKISVRVASGIHMLEVWRLSWVHIHGNVVPVLCTNLEGNPSKVSVEATYW
ncbi:hypothetical protein Droror1_Dr00022159 [Drosera rotundifolia]